MRAALWEAAHLAELAFPNSGANGAQATGGRSQVLPGQFRPAVAGQDPQFGQIGFGASGAGGNAAGARGPAAPRDEIGTPPASFPHGVVPGRSLPNRPVAAFPSPSAPGAAAQQTQSNDPLVLCSRGQIQNIPLFCRYLLPVNGRALRVHSIRPDDIRPRVPNVHSTVPAPWDHHGDPSVQAAAAAVNQPIQIAFRCAPLSWRVLSEALATTPQPGEWTPAQQRALALLTRHDQTAPIVSALLLPGNPEAAVHVLDNVAALGDSPSSSPTHGSAAAAPAFSSTASAAPSSVPHAADAAGGGKSDAAAAGAAPRRRRHPALTRRPAARHLDLPADLDADADADAGATKASEGGGGGGSGGIARGRSWAQRGGSSRRGFGAGTGSASVSDDDDEIDDDDTFDDVVDAASVHAARAAFSRRYAQSHGQAPGEEEEEGGGLRRPSLPGAFGSRGTIASAPSAAFSSGATRDPDIRSVPSYPSQHPAALDAQRKLSIGSTASAAAAGFGTDRSWAAVDAHGKPPQKPQPHPMRFAPGSLADRVLGAGPPTTVAAAAISGGGPAYVTHSAHSTHSSHSAHSAGSASPTRPDAGAPAGRATLRTPQEDGGGGGGGLHSVPSTPGMDGHASASNSASASPTARSPDSHSQHSGATAQSQAGRRKSRRRRTATRRGMHAYAMDMDSDEDDGGGGGGGGGRGPRHSAHARMGAVVVETLGACAALCEAPGSTPLDYDGPQCELVHCCAGAPSPRFSFAVERPYAEVVRTVARFHAAAATRQLRSATAAPAVPGTLLPLDLLAISARKRDRAAPVPPASASVPPATGGTGTGNGGVGVGGDAAGLSRPPPSASAPPGHQRTHEHRDAAAAAAAAAGTPVVIGGHLPLSDSASAASATTATASASASSTAASLRSSSVAGMLPVDTATAPGDGASATSAAAAAAAAAPSRRVTGALAPASALWPSEAVAVCIDARAEEEEAATGGSSSGDDVLAGRHRSRPRSRPVGLLPRHEPGTPMVEGVGLGMCVGEPGPPTHVLQHTTRSVVIARGTVTDPDPTSLPGGIRKARVMSMSDVQWELVQRTQQSAFSARDTAIELCIWAELWVDTATRARGSLRGRPKAATANPANAPSLRRVFFSVSRTLVPDAAALESLAPGTVPAARALQVCVVEGRPDDTVCDVTLLFGAAEDTGASAHGFLTFHALVGLARHFERLVAAVNGETGRRSA